MNKTFKIALSLFLTMAVSVSISFLIVRGKASSKSGFVDSARLFNEFKGKKELEAKFLDEKNKQQSLLDSLKENLLVAQQRLKTTDKAQLSNEQKTYQEIEDNYKKVYYQVDDVVKKKNDEYTKDIWNQINQYIKDYGKANHYDYIYGATGNGSMMYADTTKDITEEVVKYINAKYDGR